MDLRQSAISSSGSWFCNTSLLLATVALAGLACSLTLQKTPYPTEIAIITAQEARDALKTAYLRHLELGDGPALAGFYAPDMGQLTDWLDEGEVAANGCSMFIPPALTHDLWLEVREGVSE